MPTLSSVPEDLAKLFHETYERLAPNFSYHTRKASAVPWDDVPPNNKGLMVAVAKEVQEQFINQQIKSVFDELESELDDGKNSHSMKVISSAIQKIRRSYEH
jgi:hypothetical protein